MKRFKKIHSRIAAFVLALVMVLSVVPVEALADASQTDSEAGYKFKISSNLGLADNEEDTEKPCIKLAGSVTAKICGTEVELINYDGETNVTQTFSIANFKILQKTLKKVIVNGYEVEFPTDTSWKDLPGIEGIQTSNKTCRVKMTDTSFQLQFRNIVVEKDVEISFVFDGEEEDDSNKEEDENTKALYLASFQYRANGQGTLTLEPETQEYTISGSVASNQLQLNPTLSSDAPAGSKVFAKYVNTSGTEKEVELPTGKYTNLRDALKTPSLEGIKITIIVGVEGDTQEFVLNVERAMTNPSLSVTDENGKSLSWLIDGYVVPDGSDTVKATPQSYGTPVTINGESAESGKPSTVKVDFGEDGKFKITAVATYKEQEYTTSIVLKCYTGAEGTCNENINWKLDKNGVLTISGTGDIPDYAQYNNNPPWYAYANYIKSVVVEDGITGIGNYAFGNAIFKSLTSVKLPNGLKKIGQMAFQGCSALSEINIPDSVTEIQNNALAATALTKVVLPKGVTTVASALFTSCTELKKVEFSGEITSIGTWAFSGTGITEITIPETVTEIGQNAFENCKALKEIVIPANVTTMGSNILIGCSALETATIHDVMVAMMFQNCISLKTVNMNGTKLTSIPSYAFSSCTALEELVIPEGVKSIGVDAFLSCTGLKKVVIPSTVESMTGRAFNGCSGLTDITITGNNFVEKEGIIYNADETTVVLCEKGKKDTVQISETVTAIGEYAFDSWKEVRRIEMTDSVTSVGSAAFQKCENLVEVRLSEKLTSISDSLFLNCNSLSNVGIPASVTSIGSGAFSNCTSLTSLEIPDGVAKIPMIMLSGATGLEQIIIPTSVKVFEMMAFQNTTMLKKICYKGGPEEWDAITGNANAKPDKTAYEMVYYYGRNDVASIAKQPFDLVLGLSSDAANRLYLSVAMQTAENAKVSFTWYENTAQSTVGGTKVELTAVREDGLTSYCTPSTTELGTKYYYCVVSTTVGETTLEYPSNIVKVTIIESMWSGSGTEQDPYLLDSAEDLQSLYAFVAEGNSTVEVYFKMTKDITLPEGWKPIGVTKDGTDNIQNGNNLNAFSGIIDGNSKTLTVPEGGLPLLGYVKGATVKNLNIYGKKIAGYGLVNNLEGVGLSGSAIVIDNVTLKSGSSTLKSGFVGGNITTNGFAAVSAQFITTIKNSTIEENVIIGYDKNQDNIGSFAGRLQGTIENCVSYATVYGVNYVGGILGSRDNGLGTCVINDSKFHGTVEASGHHAGGIAGGGYVNSTAPNGNRLIITDCISDGTIKGVNKVGGILGGDSYVAQLWGAGTFKNNSFTGKVSAIDGTYVGGIIGFYNSLNVNDDIVGNYYSKDCGAEKGIGYVVYVDTNYAEHETESGAVYFNTEENTKNCPEVTGCHWQVGHNRTDDPLGKDAAKLCYSDGDTEAIAIELKVAGTYKTEYITGEELDLTGLTVNVLYNNGTEKDIPLSDVNVTGFDTDRLGEQKLVLSYEGVTSSLMIRVKNPAGNIKVIVSVLGDQIHDSEADGSVHTFTDNNLITWVEAKEYTVDSNASVWDVLQMVFNENGITYKAADKLGTVYIEEVTYKGQTLAEFTNGTNAGWMYKLNGKDSRLGVAQQYLRNGDVVVFHYTDDYTQEKYEEEMATAKDVIAMIDAIGEVTLKSEADILKARTAYEALSKEEQAKVTNLDVLKAAEETLAKLKEELKDALESVEKIYKTTGDYVEASCQNVNTFSDWFILGLARSGRNVPEEYYDYIEAFVEANIDADGRLSSSKSSTNSRVILALTATGYDVTDVKGHNLLNGLTSMNYIRKQGLNGPIWALIALDSHDYIIPVKTDSEDQVTREKLIGAILSEQHEDGGWNLSASAEYSDVDMTAMAIQALAPYYTTDNKVKIAIDKAVQWLSDKQNSDGGYSALYANGESPATSESIAQVIVALSTIGIHAGTDERFVKNGNSVVDALCMYYVEGGGFEHILGYGRDGLATEQGYYALVSYVRMLNGETALYDMSDVELENDPSDPSNPSNPDYELSEATKAVIEMIETLQDGDEEAIIDAYKAYTALTPDERLFVRNYSKLQDLTEALGQTYHYDQATGVDVRDNKETILPWYMKLVVEKAQLTDAQTKKMQEILGEEAAALVSYNIYLVNMLTGEKEQAGGTVNVKVPAVEKGSYKSLVVVHYLADGKAEFLETKAEDGNLVFDTKSFSVFAVAGSMLDYDDIVGVEKDPVKTGDDSAIWLSFTITAIAAFGVVMILAKRRENEA